jgi:hypothetical protein
MSGWQGVIGVAAYVRRAISGPGIMMAPSEGRRGEDSDVVAVPFPSLSLDIHPLSTPIHAAPPFLRTS